MLINLPYKDQQDKFISFMMLSADASSEMMMILFRSNRTWIITSFLFVFPEKIQYRTWARRQYSSISLKSEI